MIPSAKVPLGVTLIPASNLSLGGGKADEELPFGGKYSIMPYYITGVQ